MPEASTKDGKTTCAALKVGDSAASPALASDIAERSGQKLAICYQCGECTAGCPAAFAMDLTPNQVMRLAQLGLSEVLESDAIWLCAGCETCLTRCPNDVHLSRVMDAIRHIATEQGVKCPQPQVQQFHKTFLEAVESGGRVHEMTMIMRLKMRTRRFFDDVGLGMQMFRKGKLPVRGHGVRDKKAVRKLFKGTREEAGK